MTDSEAKNYKQLSEDFLEMRTRCTLAIKVLLKDRNLPYDGLEGYKNYYKIVQELKSVDFDEGFTLTLEELSKITSGEY